MKIDTDAYRVDEGRKVKLQKWPTRVPRYYRSKAHYEQLLSQHVDKLRALQPVLYADNRYALLIIFQAMDAAGKDGAIKHVMSGVNPQGCQVFSFKHPGPEALAHDFLWEAARRLPESGRIGIFNRSYYEEVLIVRVHPRVARGAAPAGGDSRGRCIVGITLPFHSGARASPARQRNAHRQVLPALVQGRAAQALSRASRRARTRTGSSRNRTSKSGNSGTTT